MTRAPETAPLRLPPGPAGGRIRQTIALHRDPLTFLRRCQAVHGDVFTVRTATAGPLVVVADPAAAADIPGLDPDVAAAGQARRRLLPPASPRSTFGGDGAEHRAARGRLRDAFTPEAVAARRPQLERITAEHVAAWPRARPFRLLPRLRCLTDALFVRTVLRVEDEARAAQLTRAIGGMLATPGNPPMTVAGPQDGLVGRVVAAEFLRRVRPVMDLLGDELDRRRAGHGPDDDLLGRLLAAERDATNGELIDELLPNIMAGQEPPAAALTWMLLELAHTPAAADRLAAGGADVRAFATESLRIHPPALASLRELREPRTIAGRRLPAGATVLAPIPLVQRDTRVVADPDRFAPFDAARAEPAVLLPFGGGARRCLGEALAWEQIDALLPEVARRLRLRPAWPRVEKAVLRATILVPARSGLVVATER